MERRGARASRQDAHAPQGADLRWLRHAALHPLALCGGRLPRTPWFEGQKEYGRTRRPPNNTGGGALANAGCLTIESVKDAGEHFAPLVPAEAGTQPFGGKALDAR